VADCLKGTSELVAAPPKARVQLPCVIKVHLKDDLFREFKTVKNGGVPSVEYCPTKLRLESVLGAIVLGWSGVYAYNSHKGRPIQQEPPLNLRIGSRGNQVGNRVVSDYISDERLRCGPPRAICVLCD
jgi:hypothetical protein